MMPTVVRTPTAAAARNRTDLDDPLARGSLGGQVGRGDHRIVRPVVDRSVQTTVEAARVGAGPLRSVGGEGAGSRDQLPTAACSAATVCCELGVRQGDVADLGGDRSLALAR